MQHRYCCFSLAAISQHLWCEAFRCQRRWGHIWYRCNTWYVYCPLNKRGNVFVKSSLLHWPQKELRQIQTLQRDPCDRHISTCTLAIFRWYLWKSRSISLNSHGEIKAETEFGFLQGVLVWWMCTAACAALSENGYGTLLFPSGGTYLTGSFNISSNTVVEIGTVVYIDHAHINCFMILASVLSRVANVWARMTCFPSVYSSVRSCITHA